MEAGEQITGTHDEHYNLVSVLYHALQGADMCDTYALNADLAGRTDLYEFFREAQVAQAGLAKRAKELLGMESATPGTGGVPSGAAPAELDFPEAPPGEERIPGQGP